MKNFDSIKDDVMVGIENIFRYAYNHGYSDGCDVEGNSRESINLARSIGRQEGWECAKRVLFDSSLPKELLSRFPKADTWAGLVKYYSVEDVLSAFRELDSTSDSKHCHTCAFYKCVCDCIHCGGQHLDWAPIIIENTKAEVSDNTEPLSNEECKTDNISDYERGCNDAWNCAKQIAASSDKGGFTIGELIKIFGQGSAPQIISNLTYSEAMTKIQEYEAAKDPKMYVNLNDVIIAIMHSGLVDGIKAKSLRNVLESIPAMSEEEVAAPYIKQLYQFISNRQWQSTDGDFMSGVNAVSNILYMIAERIERKKHGQSV